ncbi:helix-turn-helix domain-containing protein [Psychrobacillus sp. L3]|uniref:helix-turn-helix domain-containing protein n=1 Tax=Psychrobacillus sp. L3 TaxID=3236891 RepID=UPI0036F1B5CC
MIIIKLKETMKEKNFNITELAEATGMHRNGISKILNEKNNGIEFDTLNKLCTVLECDVSDIVQFTKDEK